MKKGYEEYQVNQVETADPKELVIMLYEGAIRFLEEASANIEKFEKYDLVNAKILKAQDIITELMVSLDMEKGGEIADNLLSIYVYMKKELLDANMKKEKAPIDHVISMLKNLKSAWEQLDSNGHVTLNPQDIQSSEPRKGGFVARG